MKKCKLHLQLLLLFSTIFLAHPAFAADDHDHHGHTAHEQGDKTFYGHLHVVVHADSIIDAEESDEEFNETYSHSELEFGIRLGKGFSIDTIVQLEGEPSGHSHGHGDDASEPDGSDQFFESHPLFIEQFSLNYDNDHFAAYVGKFNPVISFNYHSFPGIYGYQTIESYAIQERIGLGGAIKHNMGDYGKHRLDVSTFFADTTWLSESILDQRGQIFDRRGRNREEDGGLSNTEDFSSFAVSLAGSDFYSLNNNIVEGLAYRIGYARQAAGVDNEDDETRYTASFSYKHQMTREVSAKLLTEYVYIDHFGGEAAHDRAYSTLALKMEYRQWNIGTSYTHINNDAEEEDEDHNGNVFQISAGYQFKNGIGLGLGYQRSDEEDEVTKRIGALFEYSRDF